MSADLHIHILTPNITEGNLARFFSNNIGSKYFNPRPGQSSYDDWTEAYSLIADTPNVHVGEVSWLKAGLFDDAETYIPDAVGAVQAIIGEDLPLIDDALIARIAEAMGLENKTTYSLSAPNDVIEFLKAHCGERCFMVSW